MIGASYWDDDEIDKGLLYFHELDKFVEHSQDYSLKRQNIFVCLVYIYSGKIFYNGSYCSHTTDYIVLFG